MSEWDDETLERLVLAAADMFELLAEIRDHPLIPRCGFDDCKDCTLDFPARIDALMKRIEGGEA